MILRFLAALSLSAFTLAALAQPSGSGRVLDAKVHHLGHTVVTNWPEASAQPDGTQLDIRFPARANAAEHVLAITHREVTRKWSLQINGTEIAELTRSRSRKPHHYILPAGVLKDGQNILSVSSDDVKSDITFGPVVLHEKSFRELLRLQPVTITVTDAATGKPVPARVAITDTQDEPVEIHYGESLHTAIRRGLIYVPGAGTHLELPEGDYVFHAMRGMEWGLDRRELTVRKGAPAKAALRLRREVDTTGFIAADTHIHTLTFSGHGNASVEERIVTLAAEGVELAIATDHNHQTDYRPYQEKAGFNEFFTAVTGNEVTTSVGHFNAFPLDPDAPLPPHRDVDWVTVVAGARDAGAKVVIMNHPRWPVIERSQFTRFGLNRASGDFAADVRIAADAIEVANALTPQPDPLYLFRDWFALLNRGQNISGVGSSDSHTVEEPVGQGRSYIPSATDDPAQIDVDDACRRILAGQHSMALGIFTDVRLNQEHRMGDVAGVKGRELKIELRVASASWVAPRRAVLFLNGEQAAEQAVPKVENQPVDLWLHFSLPAPAHDAHLVCVVLGDKVSHPAWRAKADYTLAATNPIYLDADGDGKYQSPRQTAEWLLTKAGPEFESQWTGSLRVSEPIAVQMLAVMYQREEWREELAGRIRAMAAERPLAVEFLKYAPAPEPAGGN